MCAKCALVAPLKTGLTEKMGGCGLDLCGSGDRTIAGCFDNDSHVSIFVRENIC